MEKKLRMKKLEREEIKKQMKKKHFEILKIQERSKINQNETPELNV